MSSEANAVKRATLHRIDRDTAEMIAHDFDAARKKWLAETENDEERVLREESDFLRYENSEGKYADFHGLRHTFIRKRSTLDRNSLPVSTRRSPSDTDL
ncbi:MAG: hypothetical protein ACRC2T_02775 [Thermoguttaceae bacterium]